MAVSRHDDVTAVVTGGAGDIGGAIVARLADAGVRTVSLDRRDAPLAAESVRCDLASDDAVAEAAEWVAAGGSAATIVVHAAVASAFGGVADTPSADWLRLYDVNVVGAARLIRGFAPTMAAAGGGSFLFVSSINARFATPTLAAYAASKAGLESLTHTAALELADRGIRVNAIAPASIDTPLLHESFARADDPDAARAANVARHPLGRLGTADEVADLAVFLSSPSAAWITGSVVDISGGAHVVRR